MTDPDVVPAPVSYRFERADMWRLATTIHGRSWTRRIVTVLIFLALVLLVPSLVLGAWPSRQEWIAILGQPGVFLPIAAMILLGLFGTYLSPLFYLARYRSFAMADRDVCITFRDDGIETDVIGKARTSLPWSGFVARVEQPDRVFLKLARYEALTVPRRAFPDAESYGTALAFLRTKVPHGAT